jgi:hypothetical protein
LQPGSDCPNISRCKRRFGSNEFAFVPRAKGVGRGEWF